MPWRSRPITGFLRLLPALLALCLLTLSSCGESEDAPVTLKIGSRGTPEEEVLGHIYAEALERAGYKVRERSGISPEIEEAPLQELKAGEISGYPEHLDTVLGFVHPTFEAQPGDPAQARRLAQAKLRKDGLAVLPPSPYSRNRQVAFLRRRAERNDLERVSDLHGKSESMTVLGPTDCHFAMDCLGGFEKHYGVYFETISYTYTEPEVRRRFKVLDEGRYDASFVSNTDGQLFADMKKYTLLEDDKGVLPAGNVVFVVDEQTLEEAGEGLEETISAVQKGLTLPVMQRMNAEVDLEGKDPAKVAESYLSQVKLPN